MINYEVENLGIDDFSSKKREIFNTIFVDNDARKKVEVINSREHQDVVETLKKFKNIKTVTRDFSQAYKNSISEALPQAKQIVDRFHIFKNLTDHVIEYLKRTIKDTIKIFSGPIEEEKILNERQRKKRETAQRKYELALQIQELIKEGKSKKAISKILNIGRPTVIKYAEQKEPIESSYHCILDRYVPLIKKLIIEGKKIDEIYLKLKESGYKGKTSLLNSRLKGIRQEIRTNTRYLRRSQIKKLLYKDIKEIKDKLLKKDLNLYLKSNTELSNILKIMKEFKQVMFSKNPNRLRKWLEKAKKINVTELNSFITLIESDFDAVKNAIIYKYSNGLTEGFNNKTKVIKRIMYGRCSFELLRLKILS